MTRPRGLSERDRDTLLAFAILGAIVVVVVGTLAYLLCAPSPWAGG